MKRPADQGRAIGGQRDANSGERDASLDSHSAADAAAAADVDDDDFLSFIGSAEAQSVGSRKNGGRAAPSAKSSGSVPSAMSSGSVPSAMSSGAVSGARGPRGGVPVSGAKNRRDYGAADVLGDEAEAGTATRVPPVAPGMALS